MENAGSGNSGVVFACDHCGEPAAHRCIDCGVRNYCDECNLMMHKAPSVRHHRTEQIHSYVCEHDTTEVASLYCETCSKYYCRQCSDFVHKRLEFRDHSRVPLGVLKSGPGHGEPTPVRNVGMGRGTTETTSVEREYPGDWARALSGDGSSRKMKVLLFIGPAGVGKRTTINNVCGREVCETNAFESQQDDVFEVDIKCHDTTLRIIDTPGIDDKENALKVERFVRGSPVHCIFYVERFDAHRVNKKTMQLITDVFGEAIWDHTFCVLTHGMTPAREVLESLVGNARTPAGDTGINAVVDENSDLYKRYSEYKIRSVQNSIGRITRNTRRRVPVAVIENNFERNSTMFAAFIPRVAQFLERQHEHSYCKASIPPWLWTLAIAAAVGSTWKLCFSTVR